MASPRGRIYGCICSEACFPFESPLTARAGPYMYLAPTDNSSGIIRYNPPISHGREGDAAMASNPLFYQLLLVALVLICLMVHVGLPDDIPRVTKTPLAPKPPRRRRSTESKPFTGLIHQPLCEACKQKTASRPKAPGSPPPVITFTRGRRRTVDTQAHFCPDPTCSYYG